jgi:tetratricopeptide (TPR) repeat protein
MTTASQHTIAGRRKRTGDAAIVRNVVIACLFAAVAAFLVFSPTIGFDFLRYDDEIYISTNPHLRPFSLDTVIWVFTHSYYHTYTPLTLLSHAADAAVWGENARGHHLTNVILHALNTALLLALAFVVLSRLLRRPEGEADVRGGFAGAIAATILFSLHPLRVESVAWVSDRKDLLLGLFLLTSFLAYVVYGMQRGAPGAARWRRAALLLFLCAVLSKTAAIGGSLVMLALDVLLHPPAAGEFRRRVRELLPFILVSVFGGAAAILAAQGSGLHPGIAQLSTVQQILLPFYTATFFVGKMLWPFGLNPVYTTPSGTALAGFSAAALLITGGVILLWLRRRTLMPLVGWGAYLALLGPTLAGVYAGIQPWADRYTYMSMVPLAVLAGGAVGWVWSRWGGGWRRLVVQGGMAALAIAATVLTMKQLPYWADSVTLWRYAERCAPETSPEILVSLGVAYYHAGTPDSAIALYHRAIDLKPENAPAYFSMGEAYAAKGELASAAEAYYEALRRDSTHFGATNNLADIYLRTGNLEKALGMYRELVRREPANAQAQNNLGFALARKGDAAAAEAAYRTAIRLAPGLKSPHVNLAVLYQSARRPELAVDILQGALRLYPEDPGVNYNLAIALESLNRPVEAENAYRRALVSSPLFVDAWINLGNLIARTGRLQEARAMYRQVVASIPTSAELSLNLAGVYNSLGEGDSALASLQEAVKRKPDFAAAYYAMGLYYRQKGDSLASRQSLQVAVRFGSREAAGLLESSPSPGRRRR